MTKPIYHGEPPKKETASEIESNIAAQRPSTGGILPEYSFFSFIIFFFSHFSFNQAEFEEWSVKQQFIPILLKRLTSELKPEDKEARSSRLETHLGQLSLSELYTLDNLTVNYPETINFLINEKADNLPHALHPFIKDILVHTKDFTPQETRSLQGLYDTNISNGQTPEGYFYEMRCPYKEDSNIVDLEIVITHPVSGEARRQIVILQKEKNDPNNTNILQKQHSIEIELATTKSEYLKKALSQFEEIPTISKRAKVNIYKYGNIFMSQDGPSLFPKNMGYAEVIPQSEITKMQRILQNEKLKDEELPTIMVYIDKEGHQTQVRCSIDTSVVRIIDRDYLEITFRATEPKNLTYTTRIPYKTHEPNWLFHERIIEDGSLARAMLMAASAFTRELVP